jgi:3-oxoacyl-[acyl-carrier-protein] synthase-1
MSTPVAVRSVGLVTSVGTTAASACAAIRANVRNPSETRYAAASGEWLVAHQVPLAGVQGLARLAQMTASAIEECLHDVPPDAWSGIPLVLCVAERERPGRLDGLEDSLAAQVESLLGAGFDAARSLVVPHGRVAFAVAFQHARRLLEEDGAGAVLVAGADSMLCWPTLSAYAAAGRLLSAQNSNGFMPGEGAGAMLLVKPDGHPRLACTGLGFAMESAHFDSGEPLRADGLAQAIRAATADAGLQVHDLDYRITDLSGEQYYFKEATLALARLLRRTKPEFDIWHPAECIGEAGALAGMAGVAVAHFACTKGYSRGDNVLLHAANDAGPRAAVIMQYG